MTSAALQLSKVLVVIDDVPLVGALLSSVLSLGKLPLTQPLNFELALLYSGKNLQELPGGIGMYVQSPGISAERDKLLAEAKVVVFPASGSSVLPQHYALAETLLGQGKVVVADEQWKPQQQGGVFVPFGAASLESAVLKAIAVEPASTAASVAGRSPQPLRLLQVITSYEESIQQFYRLRPQSSAWSFARHIDELVRDGFNAAHTLAPALRDHGFETGVIIGNSRPAQEQWLKEQGLQPVLSHDWVRETVRMQIEHYKPDIVYTNDPLTFEASFIASLPFRPRLMAAWRAAPIPGTIRWDGYDLMVSNISGCREIMLKLGAKAVAPHSPGFPRWLADELRTIRHQVDVVFAGSLTKGHERRGQYVDFLARTVASGKAGFSCEFYVGGDPACISPAVRSLNRGEIFGRPYFEALRRARIVLDIRGSAIALQDPVSGKQYDLAGAESGSMRLFEGTGCGSLLLSDYHEGLSRYFEVGKEIAVFRNEHEMIEKMAYYTAHERERSEIAARGHERCMRDYSVERYAETFSALLRACLDGRSFPGLVRPN